MTEKVWTQEQLSQANVALWERFDHLPVEHKDAQVLQCENTEAVELLNAYIHNEGVSGPKVVEFLKRNTGGA